MGCCSASIQLASLFILPGILSLKTIQLGFCSVDHNVGCIDIERKALLKLKQGLIDPSDRLSSWVGEDCCKWSGVGCNNITRRVNMLDLCNRYGYVDEATDHAFGGEINPSLLVLKDLVYLDLSMNNFGGVQLPSFIGSLEKLKYLNLSSTSFGGIIPLNLGNLSGLLYLDLGNDFGHPIETNLQWLATLSSLKYLNLEGVNLAKTTSYWLPTGSIPKSIENLTSLEEFDLAWNQMSGIIPESLGELLSLVSLDIYGNTWEGAIIEAHFAKLGGLRRVSIENNLSPNICLVFNISSDWIPPFKLRSLYIRSCQLGPKFPTRLRNQTELTTVALNNARISNTILDWFLQLDLQLDYLDVSYNQLSGTVPNSLRFSFYSVVDLSSNRYEGPFPL
ncbi:PREDICTED: leucine-rich repeat receptor protein kinase MSL1-like [Prunus mume]|uniref:Leucine-rich repeat receptor protein kinase MSL1-like n=1 Tax=Prunus mume TaxID=102107 RepID=A0ABM1LVS6_PRUMU|nr:PREDICTED: leucine-rich repeat receptor protein kinase MSL1-like [Prunus mume]